MFEKKIIPVKNLYLIFVICVGLIALGIGSTYAVFTASAEIEAPIVIVANLTYDGKVIEPVIIEVPAGRLVKGVFDVTNSSGSTLNYVAYYVDEGLDIELGTFSGTPVGSITNGNSSTVEILIRNNTSSDVSVLIGFIADEGSTVLGSTMKQVPSESLVLTARDLYYDNSKTGADCDTAQCMIDLLDQIIESS